MAKNSEEEYLDGLVDSVSDDFGDEDFNKWFEDELDSIEDIDFNDIELDAFEEKAAVSGNEKDTKAIESAGEEKHAAAREEKQIEEKEEEGQDESAEKSSTVNDENQINPSEIPQEDNIDDIMKLLDSYEGDEKKEDPLIMDMEEDDKGKKKRKKKEKKPKKEKKKKGKNGDEQADSDINPEELLDVAGNTFEDLKSLELGDIADFGKLGNDIESGINEEILKDLDNIDSLDDIMEVEPKKKEKKKKEKKPKKVKPPKKKKIKKKAPRQRDEIIRITPLGVIFSVTFIALLIVGTYFGSQFFSYKSKIDKATGYYVDKKYTKAYNAISGMELKDEDKEFYNQVENVMRVEKHINDFNAYEEVEMYTYALEALIDGVRSYDKCLDRGRELGTYDILVSKLDEIDLLLNKYYGIDVETARSILLVEDSVKYEKKIIEYAHNVNIE